MRHITGHRGEGVHVLQETGPGKQHLSAAGIDIYMNYIYLRLVFGSSARSAVGLKPPAGIRTVKFYDTVLINMTFSP